MRQLEKRNRLKEMEQDILATMAKFCDEGLGPSEIQRRLESDPNFQGRVPNIRRTQRAVSNIRSARNLQNDGGVLDSGFELNRLTEYGIPWEASGYVLAMYTFIRENEPRQADDTDLLFITGRDARWYWRVHMLDPDLDMHEVWRLAPAFAHREYLHELTGSPLKLDDLGALIAYKPWSDKEGRQRYVQAIRDNRIPAVGGLSPEQVLRLIPETPRSQQRNLILTLLASSADIFTYPDSENDETTTR